MSYSAEGSVNIAIRAVDKASGIFGNIGGSAKGLGAKFGSLGDVAKIAGGMIVAQLAMKALAAIKQFVQESIQAFSKFEDTLVTITAISGKTGEEAEALYKNLEQAAHVSGLQFAVGANKAAAALESLVKAGMEGEQATKALNAALAMATIEQMDTAQASDLLVGVLNQFKYAAEDSAKVVDILVNASVKGIDTASGFATALSYCGATANALGFSLEETSAALVAINNQGIRAEKAGRYLGAMFDALVKKSDKLGFSLYDNKGVMLSLRDIITKLTVKLESFGTQAERDAYVQEVFGKQAARAALSLFNLSTEGASAAEVLADLEEGMSASGTTMDIVGQKLDTFAGAQAKMGSAVERLQIMFGEALAPVLTQVASFVTNYVIPAVEWLGAQFYALYERVKPVTDFLYWLAVYVLQQYVIPAFEWLAEALKPVVDALNAVAGVIGGAWDWLMVQIAGATEDIQEELGMLVEAHEGAADVVDDATDLMANSVDDATGEMADNYDLAALKAEEMSIAVKKLSEGFREQFNLMEAEASEKLSSIAWTFDEAFTTGRFEDAAKVVYDFAEAYNISFEKAEDIIQKYLETEKEAMAEREQIYQDHITDLEDRFNELQASAYRYLGSLAHSFDEAFSSGRFETAATIVQNFADRYEISFESAEEIITGFLDAEKKALEEHQQIYADHIEWLENEYFERYVENNKKFVASLQAAGQQYKALLKTDLGEAEGLVASFADSWGLTWDEAAGILADYVESQDDLLEQQQDNLRAHMQELREIYEDHVGDLKKYYFDKYTKETEEWAASLQHYALYVKDFFDSLGNHTEEAWNFMHTIIEAFAAEWGLTWDEAADVLLAAVDEMTEAAEGIAEIPQTFEEQLLGRAQRDFEEFKNCITGKARTMETDVTASMNKLGNNVTDLIKAGLVGEAQRQMQAYVDCSVGKIYDMTVKIDQYMSQLTADHNSKIEAMRDYAETLTGEEKDAVLNLIGILTSEYERKMQQLFQWKSDLLDQLVSMTEEKMEQVKDSMTVPIAEAITEIQAALDAGELDIAVHLDAMEGGMKDIAALARDLNVEALAALAAAGDLTQTISIDAIEGGLHELARLAKELDVEGLEALQGIEAVAAVEPVVTSYPERIVEVVIEGPLVNVEGTMDEAAAELAAELVQEKLESVIIEATSTEASTERIRVAAIVE